MIPRTLRDSLMGSRLQVVAPDAPLSEARRSLEASNGRAVAVMDGDCLIGLLTERSLARAAVHQELVPRPLSARKMMRPVGATLNADVLLTEAVTTMVANKVRHVPVMEGQRVLGVVSLRDIPTEDSLMIERFLDYVQRPVAMV